MWNMVQGEFQNVRSVQKCAKVHKGVGIKLPSLGMSISAWIMSAKME